MFRFQAQRQASSSSSHRVVVTALHQQQSSTRSASSLSKSSNTTSTIISTTTSSSTSCSPATFLLSSPTLAIQTRTQVGLAPPPMGGDAGKKFQCSKCAKKFKMIESANLHVRNVHQGDAKILNLEEGAGASSSSSSDSSSSGSASSQAPPQSNPNAPPTQPVSQQPQQQRTSRFSTINTSQSSGAAGGGRGGAFPTLNPNAANTLDSRSETEDRFKREIRRGKSIKDPIYKPSVEMSQEFMNELMEVWDKYGVMRLKDKYVKYSDREKAYAAKKLIEDDTIPTYETSVEECSDGSKVNPFAELEDVEDLNKVSSDNLKSEKEPEQQQQQQQQQKQEEKVVSSEISEITYAIGPKENISPFICASIENPLITSPQPPEKPQVRRQRSSASSSKLQSSSSSALPEDDDDFAAQMHSNQMNHEDAESSTLSMQQQQQQQDSSFDVNEASPFAQAMQATSPFSVSEQAAPIENQVASPFAQAAASSSSPFGSFDPSSSSQQQQQSQVQSPFGQQVGNSQQQQVQQQQQQTQPQQQIISPFADLMSPSQQQQQAQQQQAQQQQTQTYQASSTGAPLTPIEAAVDLSALFGAPAPSSDGSSSSQQQQQQEFFKCQICGKNTFKSEYALITHCQEKHGVNVAGDLAAAKNNKNLEAGVSPTGRKKVRQLPDLPPYIPTPVDLAATSPYGSTRQRSTTTAFWSEVEVSPHARMMSSITLLGEVENIISGKSGGDNGAAEGQQEEQEGQLLSVLGKPCLQFSLHIHPTEQTEEEKFVVRCFGDDLIQHLNENVQLKEGSSVFVEGLLRLNPSFDSRLRRYQANPAVHVALPNGFVQRLD